MACKGVYIDSSDEDFEVSSDFESDEESEQKVGEWSTPPVWTKAHPRPCPIQFTKVSGLREHLQGLCMDYFTMMFDDDLIGSTVKYTNRYGAEYVKRSKRSSGVPHNGRWTDITTTEFKAFLGLLLHMGTLRMTHISNYWHTGPLFGLKCFQNSMNPGRFLVILRCLQFSSNNGSSEDPLRKVRNMIDYFNAKMDKVYYPSKILSIGEGKTIWRAQVLFPSSELSRQGEPMVARGVKMYTLTDAEGMALRLELRPVGLHRGECAMADIVMSLLQGKLNNGHAVYLDRSYTSFTLARSLLTLNTLCTGLLRLDRRHTPHDITSAWLKKGETVARVSEGVMIGRWKGEADMTYISTEFNNTMTTVLTRTGMKTKPIAIARCNVNKVCRREGPVAGFEEEMPCFRFERRAFTWTKRLFVHILNLCVANSFFMYRRHDKVFANSQRSYQNFRLVVIQALLPLKEDSPEPETTKIKPVILQRAPEHTPSKAEKGTLSTKRKRCRVCGDKGQRKDTTYVCKACPGEPGLCVIRCFDEFHCRRFNSISTQCMMDIPTRASANNDQT